MGKQKDYGLQGADKLSPKTDGDKGLQGGGGLKPQAPKDDKNKE